jgi:hypothetical protein
MAFDEQAILFVERVLALGMPHDAEHRLVSVTERFDHAVVAARERSQWRRDRATAPVVIAVDRALTAVDR